MVWVPLGCGPGGRRRERRERRGHGKCDLCGGRTEKGGGGALPPLPPGRGDVIRGRPMGCRIEPSSSEQRGRLQFLRLNCHEEQVEAALALLPRLEHLRSLVLKVRGHLRDDGGSCLRGALTTLPPSLSALAHLVHLDLSFNSLRVLPACIPEMRALQALLLSHNLLEGLPEALGALQGLTFLSVSSNCLRALPTGVARLSALQRLDLSENLLESVPEEIGALSGLTELSLASNLLQSLPDSLASSPPPPGRSPGSFLPPLHLPVPREPSILP
uniref:Uncharacterized protein n=1 Tax=Monodelphis domestica TaxID=13616 RepID=H9H6Q8_MONDO